MADLGSIARSRDNQVDPRSNVNARGFPRQYTGLRICGQLNPNSEKLHRGGRLNSDGYPLPPCIQVINGGVLRYTFPVAAGLRGVTVRVREVSDLAVVRPQMRVLADTSMGIPVTLTATAGAGTGWLLLGPLAFTAPAKGAITVELEAFTGNNQHSDCRWDALTIS